MIGDYPDLLAELHESTQALDHTRLMARVTYEDAQAAAMVVMAQAKVTYDNACEDSWQRERNEYVHIRERASLRGDAKKKHMSLTITDVRMLHNEKTTVWDIRNEFANAVSIHVGHIYMYNGDVTDMNENLKSGQFYAYDAYKKRLPKNFITFNDALEALKSNL